MEIATIMAVIGGMLVVFTFMATTWKLFRFIFKVDKALPTLLNIAAQFESNGGSTLKDKIEKLAEKSEFVSTENRVAVKIAEDSRTIANTNAAIVNELAMTQTEDIKHLRNYLHEKMRELNNAITKTNIQASLTERRSIRIEERLDKLLPYVVRHRFTDDLEEGGPNA